MKTTFARSGKSKLLLWLAGLLCFAIVAPNARADEGDPPSRVARISFLDGTVSFQPGGEGDWGSAARNRPVTIGDKLWTDKASRAELQAGQASIHMGSMTALSFLNLDENIMQVRIAEGAINFRVRELREGDVYEVDTPNVAFTVRQAGAFRVDVSENGDATAITAIRGEGEVTAGGQTYTVHIGDRAEFNGVDNPEYKVTAASAAPDGLDRWAAERDLREDNSTSSRYVSQDVPGRADLDDNGTWSEEPEYGHVWYPNTVEAGWAPYSDGYWNWVGPWGWTWVGYEPWGFAPYHYGRWQYIGSRWGWCPGPIYARPFYGPAFVGFLGGEHWSVGFGFGGGYGVGWFPLGFREPYYPCFRASRGYINNINIHNTTVNNINVLNGGAGRFNYAYARNTNAVTVASRNAFVGGQAINRHSVRVTQASLRGAQVTDRISATPTRQSSFGAANMRARSTPPAAVQNRTVVARTAPAAAASRMPVRTLNTSNPSAGRSGNNVANRTTPAGGRSMPPNNTAMPNRQNQLSQDRPGNNAANRTVPAGSRPTPQNNTGGVNRQNQLSQNRPPSAVGAANNPGAANGASNTRTWAAQGNSTDRGRAPQGFGSNTNRPNSTAVGVGGNAPQPAPLNRSDRPPGAGSGSNGGTPRSPYSNSNSNSNGWSYQPPSGANSGPPSRSYQSPRSSYPSSRPDSAPRSNSAPPRSYSAPQSYSAPSRSYSPPTRSYSPPPRSSSAPPQSYSAPSRSYSAPSRSYSGPSHSNSAPSRSSAPPSSGGSRGGGGPHH
jgi:hypothetical protein